MTNEEAIERVVTPELLVKARELVDDWREAVFRGEMAYVEATNDAMKSLLASFGDEETLRDWSPPELSIAFGLRTIYMNAEQTRQLRNMLNDR